MFGQTYYHGSIRRYITLFGTLFNDIFIRRYNAEGEMVKLIKVPITYGPKDKLMARVISDPNLDRPQAIELPYMSFELNAISYDAPRKLNTVGRMVYRDDNKNVVDYNYNPVPYNLEFTLTIMVKNAEDGSKILEQILPYFTPDWTASIRIIDDPEIVVDIPTIIGKPTSQDTYESNFIDRRALTWTIPFTMKAYIFGPIRKSKIIKQAIAGVGYRDGIDSPLTGMQKYESITVQPGLTADGKPTSNVAESVAYSEIDWTDDYGFCVTINKE